ncbi:DUF3923 family protein [Liquorilactobacillus ghanensis]|nr:DUF3923 family protein [Liquorilactobacillus ghanensis]
MIFIRKVDGYGTIQTPATKLAAFIVLAIFFVFIVLVQLIILIFVKHRK